jgi:hypothetical protein
VDVSESVCKTGPHVPAGTFSGFEIAPPLQNWRSVPSGTRFMILQDKKFCGWV